MLKTKQQIAEEYAQRCVEDMDIDDLMNAVKDAIEDRMAEMEFPDVVDEVQNSAYADDIL